jgi:hypothetical protein
VAVRAVQARTREEGLQPEEQRLVAYVHAQRYLRTLPITTEMALADEDADDQPSLDIGQLRIHEQKCFTVKKNVKRGLPCLSPWAA